MKWLHMRNSVTILPLKFKLSGKFQRFNTADGSIEMLKNNWILKNFSLNEKLILKAVIRLKEII